MRELLKESNEPALFVLPSGFLETDEELELVRANRELVRRDGNLGVVDALGGF